MVIIAGLSQTEFLGFEADAEGKARSVEAVGGFHFNHLAVAVSQLEIERAFDS